MKVTVTTTTEKDIDTPYYTVNGGDFFAVLSKNSILCVATIDNNAWVSRQGSTRKLEEACKGREITAEEFYAQYEKALRLLNLKTK